MIEPLSILVIIAAMWWVLSLKAAIVALSIICVLLFGVAIAMGATE